MAGFDLPVRRSASRGRGAVDMILQLTRMRDGSRKLTSVCEVVGLEGDVVTTQEIARYDQRGVDKDNKVRGSFIFTGVQPMSWASSRNTASPTTPRPSELERVASW